MNKILAAALADVEEREGLVERLAKIKAPSQSDLDSDINDRKILAIGRLAERQANPSGLSFEEKIRRCAGTPDNDADDPMLKALSAVETALAELDVAPVRVPPKPPQPARQTSAGRPTLIGPFVGTRPAAKPPAPSVSPATAEPKIVGPSDRWHLDDGRRMDLSYWNFRDRLAGDLRSGRVGADPAAIIDHAADHYGLNRADAAQWVEQFFDSVGRDLARRQP